MALEPHSQLKILLILNRLNYLVMAGIIRTYAISILLLFSLSSSSQEISTNAFDVENDPYRDCLNLFLTYFIPIWDAVDSNFNDTVFVGKRDYIENYDRYYNGVYIQMLSNEDLHRLTRKNKEVSVIHIQPIKFEEGSMRIGIIHFGVKRRRKKYNLLNNDSVFYGVNYNCESKTFECVRITSFKD